MKMYSLFTYLGPASSLLVALVCCGFSIGITLLAILGFQVDFTESALVPYLVPLLALGALGFVHSFWKYRQSGPSILGLCSIVLLGWVFYEDHSEAVEMVGFTGLIVASLWDLQVKKRICSAQEPTGLE
jgi:hypothetical protein